jgi:hypothetical protein
VEFVLHDGAIMPVGALDQGYKGFGLAPRPSPPSQTGRFASVRVNP